ncbi:MAG TPA: DUF2231 domain-containing protein [Micropepsaceae bacterium]|nr:DUF2231 domain-containing protein [Micropepsaceae bacterium]
MDTRTDPKLLDRGTVSNPRSTAQIAGHPLHPMLIPFPVACFVLTLFCDIYYFSVADTAWVLASEWLLGAGLIMAGLAAVMGLIDFLGERRIRNLRASWWHMGLNVSAVLISLYNFFMRYVDGAAAGLPVTGIVLSAIVVAILLVSGWLGWQMVYKDRVGIADY